MQLKKIQMTILSASLTALMCSSVTQASDLQIYAMPTAGNKTIIMMLDTSGSMGYGANYDGSDSMSIEEDYKVCVNGRANIKTVSSGTTPKYDRYYCQVDYSTSSFSAYQRLKDQCEVQSGKNGLRCFDRLTRLKDGMFRFLNSTDPKLKNVVVGLGHYSEGDGIRARVLKEAKKLDALDSQQRQALKTEIANLKAWNGTPTSHALAEGVAYLLGNSTVRTSTIQYYEAVLRVEESVGYWRVRTCDDLDSVPNANNTYRECDDWNSWGKWSTTKPAIIDSAANSKPHPYGGTIYYELKTKDIVDNTDSGFSLAPDASKILDKTKYKSPLPENKVTCDGQGVYVLSDGDPNNTSDARSQSLMSRALGYAKDSDFKCPDGLLNINSDSGWKCMGAFSKEVYNKQINPLGVSIQTAFVGFGTSFTSLSNENVKNACRLGSKLIGDQCSHFQSDGLTQNTNSELKNPINGYGNGGFYTANTPDDITKSVLNFIDNLGTDPLEPLPTGSLSVPVDSLNPNGLQNLGYLRMLEPNPAQPSLLTWAGNLKKYTMKDGVLVDGTTNVFDTTGNFNTNTKNLWGARTVNDGGKVNVGGTYEMLPMPTTTKKTALRNVMTDVTSVTGTTLDPLLTNNNGTYQSQPLLKIVKTTKTSSKEEVLNAFRNQATLKDFPISTKLKLLNYLGFKVDTSLGDIPANNDVSYEGSPYVSIGGIIHSFPVQMTYSGQITATGELATGDITLQDGTILKPRNQSVLYGSMEGGLHIVDAATGVEQMVFIPAEILNNTTASTALVKGGSGTPAPAHGVDAPWIVDSTYRTTGVYPNSQVNAIKMNVYGGLRMGGSSYYGLDVLNPAEPKLKFRVGSDQADYTRMGQSWSKPVLIDIRYQGVPTRALVVGGGYDACYENPRFKLGTANPSEYQIKDSAGNVVDSCNKTEAKGNAVYVIDAETGKRLFWVSNTGSNANNADLKHSVVSRISTLDRDGDGYVDHLYFGDLGGQIFRVDMNNYQTKSLTTTGGTTSTSYSNFGVRTVRLANLATTSTGTSITNGDNPRFYEPVTLTIHDEDSKTFIHVGAASGDRSTPLDVAPIKGREGLSPYVALTNRPTNRVYGVFDLDFMKEDLITNTALTGNYTSTTTETAVPTKNRLITRNLTLADLLGNPQTSITGNETIYSKFFSTTAPKHGWYRSLSWSWDYQVEGTGRELANNTFRQSGGLKAFEEPIAIGNNLFVPVYDPEGTGVTPQNPCLPRVIGETDRQQYCLPFGVCVTAAGIINVAQEGGSGFRVKKVGDEYKNTNVIGKGIQGIALANNGGGGSGSNSCGNYTLATLNDGVGNWQCTRVLNPTRWFEKR